MDLDVIQSGSTCVLRVKGPLKMGPSLDQFNEAIRTSMASGHPFLILNLEAVPMIDSSAIGAVVGALQLSKKAGGDTKLVNPSSFVLKTFKMVQILSLFSVFEDEAAAVAACGA